MATLIITKIIAEMMILITLGLIIIIFYIILTINNINVYFHSKTYAGMQYLS